MKDEADKARCHPRRRGRSEHPPSEGFTATRFRKAQISDPPIGAHRVGRAYGPEVCGF
jgi:hypothetical protein